MYDATFSGPLFSRLKEISNILLSVIHVQSCSQFSNINRNSFFGSTGKLPVQTLFPLLEKNSRSHDFPLSFLGT